MSFTHKSRHPDSNSLIPATGIAADIGKVLTWQLTKGTAFSQIGPLLSDLKERIKTVYTDDCCKLRQKITSLLGENTSMKLDLFHATKRITQTLCKKHPLLHQCTQDLRLVFREDGDSEPKRFLDTPGPDKMLQKFQNFLDKWKDAKDLNGKLVFTSDTLAAAQKLKKHILNGCLCNIPPGGGTNGNERLHFTLNGLFTQCKLGILLSYALLTISIHAHNTSERIHGRVISKPVTMIDAQHNFLTSGPA